MALPYSYATLATARSQLANRLYDPNMVFWTSAELTLYIQESLQTFNALAQYWRGDFVFPLYSNPTAYGEGIYGEGGYGGISAGENVVTDGGYGEGAYGEGPYGGISNGSATWYDITQVVNTLRPYTVTDVNLYTIMEYHLLENPSGATWTGTEMFTINDLMNAVQRRRDEIMDVTGCTINLSFVPAVPLTTRTVIDQSVLDIRRIAWFPTALSPTDTSNIPVTLWPEDVWSFQSFEDTYTTLSQGTPQYYALSTQPPISFDVDTVPNRPGQYEMLTVNAGTALTTQYPTLINIPTDFAWVLKWGALADLLSKESEAKDVARAEYCNYRYQQGMKLLRMAPAVLQMRVNNVTVWVDSVRAADEYDSSWEAQAAGNPTNVYVAGLNLLAFSPTPDTNTYSATATVVQNAPIPVADTDYIQVSQGDYDVIIDYAQHLALFKNGGDEFSRTQELYARFVRQAAVYNSKLAESGEFQNELYGNSQREEMMNPRLTLSVSESLPGGKS